MSKFELTPEMIANDNKFLYSLVAAVGFVILSVGLGMMLPSLPVFPIISAVLSLVCLASTIHFGRKVFETSSYEAQVNLNTFLVAVEQAQGVDVRSTHSEKNEQKPEVDLAPVALTRRESSSALPH